MKTAALLAVLLCLFFCTEVWAGIGKPVPVDSLGTKERSELINKISDCRIIRTAAGNAGEGDVQAFLERLPDRDLKLLAQHADGTLSGGATGLEEALVALAVTAMIVGAVLVLLLVLGVVAIFGSGRTAPMGSAQYNEQRRRTQEMQEVGQPAEQGK